MVNHASLFTGIGGFDLAAEWMGWNNVFQVEIDKFCNKVLEKNFPHAKRYGDIKQFDGKPYRGTIDVLTGGFPCQPFSHSGQRKGTDDNRYLWPEMLRVIGEVQAPFIVGENVRGLTNWSGGLVFETVQVDLEDKGYEVTSFLLPACAVQAPHRRDRIWFIAYNDKFCNRRKPNEVNSKERGEYAFYEFAGCSLASTNSNNSATTRQRRHSREILPITEPERSYDSNWERNWIEVATKFCGVVNGVSHRVDRLTGLGNAIVPKEAYEIFKALNL